MKRLSTLMVMGLLLAGCESVGTNSNGTTNSANAPSSSYGSVLESDADKAITQRVRQVLANDESLPPTVRNITVATSNGVVTLKGNVRSDAEKSQIASRAQQIPGVKDVDNQLEVSTR